MDAPAGGSKKKELSENAFIKKSKKNEISARLKKVKEISTHFFFFFF